MNDRDEYCYTFKALQRFALRAPRRHSAYFDRRAGRIILIIKDASKTKNGVRYGKLARLWIKNRGR